MEVPIEQQLEELFTKLKGQIDASKLKGALKTSEQILEIVPGDIDALKCKIVSLIQLERCSEALATCGATTELQFEKAYCLYRLSKFDEALEVCKSVQGEKSSPLLQLEAQVLHRLDRAQECIAVYGELLQKQKTQSSNVGTNIVAAYVEGGRSAEVPALMQELKLRTKDSFELAYNNARALSAVGDFEAAEEQLLLAQRLGKEVLLEEDMPEAEVEEELMPITVQLAYIAAQQGRTAEALEAYTSVLKLKAQPESLSAVAVATNNLVALRGARDLFDSLKRFDRLMANPSATCSTFQAYLESKLSGSHKQSMLFNRCLLLLHSNKAAACKELSQVLAERFTSSDMPFLIQAALALREKKGAQTKADDVLSAFAAAHPDVASRVQLMRAQISAAAGNWK
ncbi:Signal recognition particle core component [Cymbomonas tetramitiformis]|uniref:Signal recognition particle core component n=1 Tax=Cymbomonas tetramitiformis TaxID=36881 RepID=A0AAE0GUU1_9CHLO|nr:Signal recognition particle core component [Cymbomonas tetramitiformis]